MRGQRAFPMTQAASTTDAAYNGRRDYAPIELYLKRPGGRLEYVGLTKWAKSLREARERFAIERGFAASDLTASYKAR